MIPFIPEWDLCPKFNLGLPDLNLRYSLKEVALRGKCPNMEFFLVHLFPHLEERSLCIQSECGKIRTKQISVFGHFSRSVSHNASVTSHRYKHANNNRHKEVSGEQRKWINIFSHFLTE